MLIPNVMGPCPLIPRSQEEPPRAWQGTQLSLSTISSSSKGWQHVHAGAHHCAFSISFPPPGSQSERTAGNRLAPKSRAVASLGLCSSSPSRPSPRSLGA